MIKSNKAKWLKARLGDILELKYGFALPENKRTEGNVPVYASSGIVGYHNVAAVKSPGIIVGRKGNVGSVSFSQQEFYPIDTVYYIDSLKVPGDLKYFYYLLQRVPFKRVGSDVGVPGLNRDMAYNLDISFPEDLEEQKRIAGILSVFDEKIELNNKINQTLEQLAQTIFQEWFNTHTEGKVYNLLEIAKFVNGGAFGAIVNKKKQGLPLIKIADLNRGISENTEWINQPVEQKYYIYNGDLLFSWSGSVDLFIWSRGKAILNQHIFNVLTIDNKFNKGFLYFLLKSKLAFFKQQAGAKATTMGHIKKEHIEEQTITVPVDFDVNIFDSIYNQIANTYLETVKLKALRDLLLLKLMNGNEENIWHTSADAIST